jgi:actin related protein 2/3 complex subunit 2
MIILEVESAILRTLLERSLDPNEKLSGEYNFCDFDGVRYRLVTSAQYEKEKLRAAGQEPPKADKKKGHKKGEGEGDEEESAGSSFVVEIQIGCAKELDEYGAKELYDQLYSSYKIDPLPAGGINFTHAIQIDLGPLNEADRKALITLAARLKTNLLGAPFIWVANRFAAKENFAPFEIPYRGDTGESFFITPTDNGASCTHRIRFSDPGDKIIGGVFFQELSAARTRVSGAPIVTFRADAPADVATIETGVGDKSLYAYVSVGLQGPQLSDRKKGVVADYLPIFRNYLHYHIKCAKAFMHQKMRARTAAMLKTLAAATPEPKVKVRRTATGKVVGAK